MNDLIDILLLIIGLFFILTASIGLLRMPDLMVRMHAVSKAGTVGVGFVMLAVANHFADFGVTVRALSIILFLLGTAPVASHLIGRAAYKIGVPPVEKYGG
ncbi:MAG: monovalent cation/H(+) antiporter subunit G [Deinococcales bacterium]